MKSILENYKERLDIFQDMTKKMESLLEELLSQNNIKLNSITSRVKTETNLSEKIIRKNNKYSRLDEITDVVGIRIITYFEDDVEKTVELINKEFDVDEVNSINKKDIMDIDRFGYLSYHLVVENNHSRNELVEYSRFKNIKFEIQIRSILQHAWAEIEHDIGYKSKQSVPHIAQRRLSRIAGLLELADSEFNEIKKTIIDYREDLSNAKVLKAAEINSDSLTTFIEQNKTVKEIDNFLAENNEYVLGTGVIDVLRELNYLGILTISELNKVLSEKKEAVKEFGGKILNQIDSLDFSGVLSRGVSIFYLLYYLVCKTKSETDIFEYLDAFGIAHSGTDRRDFAKELLIFYNEVKA